MVNKAEKTKAFIVKEAAALFNKKGYQATSLSDITSATALTKGAVYGNFGNKNELAAAAFRFNYNKMAKRFQDFLADYKTGADKLKGFLDFYRFNWDDVCASGGCPVLNASTEVDDELDFLRPVVRASLQDWSASMKSIIEQGQAEGFLRNDIDVESYAYNMIGMIEGGVMLAKVMDKKDLLFNILDQVQKMIDSELKL